MIESKHFRFIQSENSRTIEIRGYWPVTTVLSLLRQASRENADHGLARTTPVLEEAVKNLFGVLDKGGVITGTGRIVPGAVLSSLVSTRNFITPEFKTKLGYKIDAKNDKVIPVIVLGEGKQVSMPRIESMVSFVRKHIIFALKENDIKPEDARIDPDSLARLVLAEAAVKWGKGNVTPGKIGGA